MNNENAYPHHLQSDIARNASGRAPLCLIRVTRIALLAGLCISMPGIGASPPKQAPATDTTVKNPAHVSQVAPRISPLTMKKKPMIQHASLTRERYEPIKKPNDAEQATEIELFVGESRVFSTPGVARIAVGNGQIITANALDEKDVIIFANGVGTSTLFVWNQDGRYQRVKVHVLPGDMSRYAREVATFLATIPKAKATVVGDKVIVEGDELSDADRDKVAELAKRYPQIVNFTSPIGWEKMVMMDVKVVEFPRAELRELGLKWSAAGGAAVGTIWNLGGRGDRSGRTIAVPPESNPPISSPGAATPFPSSLTVLSALNMGLNAQLIAMEQKGVASVLAEPQLSTRSGYKASFLAGGEIPYSVATINGVTVQFKPYGIKLDIEPRVGRNGIIRAVVESEVSSIDSSVGTVGGPGLLTRRTKTEFNVNQGETMVLSGLIQRNSSTDIDKVPFLGDIPILGALFRSKRFQNKETELVVFVTPSIVDSQSPGLVDKVRRANERLGEQLAPPPFLSNPLQPGRDAAGFNQAPSRSSEPERPSPTN